MEEYLDFSQVLLKPKRSTLSSRKEAITERTFKLPYCKHSITGIPIMSANMDTVTTFDASRVLSNFGMFSVLHKHYSVNEYVNFYESANPDMIFHSMGISDNDIDKYWKIKQELGFFPNVCIDIANGYSEKFVDLVSRFRDIIKEEAVIMAGNVATPEIVEELILRGADIVKVGIGSGAMCTTRHVTGVGVPQFSCAKECSSAAHGVNGHVCSDGGITSPGDVVKALGAGADFVMVGSQFAGHKENTKDVNDIKIYGMSSSTAMNKYNGGVAEYRSSEGRTASIEYRGNLEDTIKYYLGGLRSGMTYIGASSVKDIPKRATFIKVSNILNELHSKDTITIR